VFAVAGSRLRRPAGLAGAIVVSMPARTAVIVLEPAQQRDGLRWWRVRVELGAGHAEEGWMAQTAPSGAVLLSAV
jgi:hypothetical protein